MVTHLPSDLESTFAYRNLVKRLGAVNAAYAFTQFWFDLGYQATAHGRCGIYLAADIPLLKSRFAPLDGEVVIRALLESGICEMRGQDLFCPIFFHFNAHLDHSWIPALDEWLFEWRDMVDALKSRKYDLARIVEPLAWELPGGGRVSDADMTRALRLIQTVDFILRHDTINSRRNASRDRMGHLHYRPRPPFETGLGLIQAALAVVLKHSDTKLAAWLQRFLSLNRPRLDPRFPFSTEEVLRDFEGLTWVASPQVGIDQWISDQALKGRFPENFEQETRNQGLRRELRQETTTILRNG